MANQSIQLPGYQQGAVLVIGLLFLVMLTLIGVTAMSTTGLEQRMAGNSRDWQLSYEAAEAVLRDAEIDISSGRVSGETGADCSTTGTSPNYDGLCHRDSTTPAWQWVNWSDSASNIYYILYGAKSGASSTSFTTGYASKPRYIIDPQQAIVPGQTLIIDKKTYSYRISGVGYGGTSTAQVTLESTFNLQN